MAGLHEQQLPVLLLLCRRDATAQVFLAQLQLEGSNFLTQAHVHRVDFAEADHTFSRAEWRGAVEAGNACVVRLALRSDVNEAECGTWTLCPHNCTIYVLVRFAR